MTEDLCPHCGGSYPEHAYHGHDGPEWRCLDEQGLPMTDKAPVKPIHRTTIHVLPDGDSLGGCFLYIGVGIAIAALGIGYALSTLHAAGL